jgi:ferritin-like metal-binding protein YciE
MTSTNKEEDMKYNKFYDLFVDLLFNMYSGELQILAALPTMIKAAQNNDFKENLSIHLGETKKQVERLDEIFSILGAFPNGEFCYGISGILKEGEEIIESEKSSAICDAALIAVAQKIEHYEIAAYTTLRNLAKHFNYSDVANLLKQTLIEEIHADKKLGSLAEGGFFTEGINDEAEKVNLKGSVL